MFLVKNLNIVIRLNQFHENNSGEKFDAIDKRSKRVKLKKKKEKRNELVKLKCSFAISSSFFPSPYSISIKIHIFYSADMVKLDGRNALRDLGTRNTLGVQRIECPKNSNFANKSKLSWTMNILLLFSYDYDFSHLPFYVDGIVGFQLVYFIDFHDKRGYASYICIKRCCTVIIHRQLSTDYFIVQL